MCVLNIMSDQCFWEQKSMSWNTKLIPIVPDYISRSYEAKRLVCGRNWRLLIQLLPLIHSLKQMVWSDVWFANKSILWIGSFWYTRSPNRTTIWNNSQLKQHWSTSYSNKNHFQIVLLHTTLIYCWDISYVVYLDTFLFSKTGKC